MRKLNNENAYPPGVNSGRDLREGGAKTFIAHFSTRMIDEMGDEAI